MSSSTSTDPSLSDLFAEIKVLQGNVRTLQFTISSISRECQAILAAIQSDEDLDVDMEDSDADEPSRVRVGSLASAARVSFGRPAASTQVANDPLSDSDKDEPITRPSLLRDTQPSKTMYRFR